MADFDSAITETIDDGDTDFTGSDYRGVLNDQQLDQLRTLGAADDPNGDSRVAYVVTILQETDGNSAAADDLFDGV